MIVKKISYTNFSKTKARRIGDLVDYIRQPHDRNLEEKVACAGAKNFTATTHEGQRAEMIFLAERSKKSRMPVSHWIFSWREGEQSDYALTVDLPPVETAADLPKATASILAAAARGELTPQEENALSAIVTAHSKAVDVAKIVACITAALGDAQQEGIP